MALPCHLSKLKCGPALLLPMAQGSLAKHMILARLLPPRPGFPGLNPVGPDLPLSCLPRAAVSAPCLHWEGGSCSPGTTLMGPKPGNFPTTQGPGLASPTKQALSSFFLSLAPSLGLGMPENSPVSCVSYSFDSFFEAKFPVQVMCDLHGIFRLDSDHLKG